MKLPGFLLLALSIAAAQLQAQVPGGFIPIDVETTETSEDFIDGESTIADIEFVGLDDDGISADTDARVLSRKRLHEGVDPSRYFIKRGDPFSGLKIFKLRKAIAEWLSSENYPLATIKVFGSKLPEGKTTLRFVIDRGPLVSTINVEFLGNDHVLSRDLLDDFKKCGDEIWERYSLSRYKYIAGRCSVRLFRSRGYLKVKVLEITSQVTSGVRNVKVAFQEGARYRVGRIKVDGNHVFPTNQIIAMLDMPAGKVLNGASLQTFAFEKLKERYDELGYMQYDADWDLDYVEPKRSGLDGIANVTLTVYEGKVIRVRKVRFASADEREQGELEAMFDLKAGDILSHRRLNDAVDRFNERSRYQPLDVDQDVEILMGDDDVDLVLKLKKIENE